MPTIHGQQKKALAVFVLGVILAGRVVVPRVAESSSLSGINPAQLPSIERRLARFLANERMVVTEGWKRFLHEGLPLWRTRQV